MKRLWRAEEVRRGVMGSEGGQELKTERKRDGIPSAYGNRWRWGLADEQGDCCSRCHLGCDEG